jgi:hypothetical protein
MSVAVTAVSNQFPDEIVVDWQWYGLGSQGEKGWRGSEQGCQDRIDHCLKKRIVLRKEVNIHAPGLVPRPQAMHQRFWWYVDSPDAIVAHRFKPRQHLLSDYTLSRLGQA